MKVPQGFILQSKQKYFCINTGDRMHRTGPVTLRQKHLTLKNCQNCRRCKQVAGSFRFTCGWRKNVKNGWMRCSKHFWLNDRGNKERTYYFRLGYWNPAKMLNKYPKQCGFYKYMGRPRYRDMILG